MNGLCIHVCTCKPAPLIVWVSFHTRPDEHNQRINESRKCKHDRFTHTRVCDESPLRCACNVNINKEWGRRANAHWPGGIALVHTCHTDNVAHIAGAQFTHQHHISGWPVSTCCWLEKRDATLPTLVYRFSFRRDAIPVANVCESNTWWDGIAADENTGGTDTTRCILVVVAVVTVVDDGVSS